MEDKKPKKKVSVSKEAKVITAKKQYFFPTYQKTVEAESLEEAQVIIKELNHGK